MMLAHVFVAIAVAFASGQPAAEQTSPRAAAKASPPAFDAAAAHATRLAALDPNKPLGYFELAEEVAQQRDRSEARQLASHLFVLALDLSRKQGKAGPDNPEWLPSGACLALADLASNQAERRWLVALAGTLRTSREFTDPASISVAERPRPVEVDPTALELTEALAALRRGDGRRAEELLTKPAVWAMLEQYEGLLDAGGMAGGAARLRHLAEQSPMCTVCRGRRYEKTPRGLEICPACAGRPGPRLTLLELEGQLRLESVLLNGSQRSWAAQVVADGGAPLRELDADAVAEVFRVDVNKVRWNGQWVEPPTPVDQTSANQPSKP